MSSSASADPTPPDSGLPTLNVDVEACKPPEARDSPGDGAVDNLCAHLANASLISSHAEFEAAFEIGPELGRGAFSVVYAVSCRPESGRPAWGSDGRAVKIMSKEYCFQGTEGARELKCHDERSLRRMRDECRVLSELKHPHVIGLFEMFESPNEIYLLMERATGGELFDAIVRAGAFETPRIVT